MRKKKMARRLRALEKLVHTHLLEAHAGPTWKLGEPRPAFAEPHHSEAPGGSTVYPCRHTGCRERILIPDGGSFVDLVLNADWALRRHVAPTPPELWCPAHASEHPSARGPKADLTIVDDYTPQIVFDMIGLAAANLLRERPSLDEVAGWSRDQRKDAGVWAASVHLSASDNAIDVPPLPEVLRKPDPYLWYDGSNPAAPGGG